MDDVWDIGRVPPVKMLYPTQKPVALIQRIIEGNSKEGDLILDPFCGCGTAITVAQLTNRKWIGIDVAQAAINTIKKRLGDEFGKAIKYKVIGEPTSVYDAKQLAKEDPYQFQWWSTGLVGARPIVEKKGADQGIDGRLFFRDDPTQPPKLVVISVKAGHTGVSHVRDLKGVVEREKAVIGVLITMEDTTKDMRTEAGISGTFKSPFGDFPRIQLLTITELLSGKKIAMPQTAGVNITFKPASKAKTGKLAEQPGLEWGPGDEED